MRDFSDDLASFRDRLDAARGYLRIDELEQIRPQLETEASRPDLWDDPDRARKVTGELSAVVDDIERWTSLAERIDDAETLFDLGREEADDSVEGEINDSLAALGREFDELELRALFTGEHDEQDALLEVHSGAGGTDSQDWANMLLRMYLRWAERRGFDIEIDEVQAGQEAGITSATVDHPRSLRVRPAPSRARRASPRAHLAVRQQRAPPHRVRVGCGGPVHRGSRHRDRDRREGSAGRHLPFVRCGRPARQRHRLRRTPHSLADRCRGVVPERTQPTPEQGSSHADPEGQARRARAAEARSRS